MKSLLRYSQSTIQFESSEGKKRIFMTLKFLNWSGKINIWFDPIFAKLKIFSAFLEHRHLQHLLILENIEIFYWQSLNAPSSPLLSHFILHIVHSALFPFSTQFPTLFELRGDKICSIRWNIDEILPNTITLVVNFFFSLLFDNK